MEKKKSRDITLFCIVNAMVFPVVTYGCESWSVKKAECQKLMLWTAVLEKNTENPLDSKEVKPINPKGDHLWIFTRKIMLKLKVQYFGHLMLTDDSSEKSDAEDGWEQKEKRASEDEMTGRHHQCNEHELGQTLGKGEGQGGLVCCYPWGHKESDIMGDWTTSIDMPLHSNKH